jgi:hypothetical protein
MRFLLNVLLVAALSAMPLAEAAQQPTTESQVVDRIVTRESEEMRLIRQFSPLVETYVQDFREDKHLEQCRTATSIFSAGPIFRVALRSSL